MFFMFRESPMNAKKLYVILLLSLFSSKINAKYEGLANNLFYKSWGLITLTGSGIAMIGVYNNYMQAFNQHISFINAMDGLTFKDKCKSKRNEYLLHGSIWLAMGIPLLVSSYKFFNTKAY